MNTDSSVPKPSRPRGLWKAARETPKPRLDATPIAKRPLANDHYYARVHRPNGDDHISSDGDCCDSDSSTSSLSKKPRISESPPTSEEDAQEEVIFWDYSRKCFAQPERLSKWITRSKVMDTSSISSSERIRPARTTWDRDDWEDLKELFSKAVDTYEDQEPCETMPLLRGVIHECHRFMTAYQDPSTLFATLVQADKLIPSFTPPEERAIHEWLVERPPLYPPTPENQVNGKSFPVIKPTVIEPEKKCKCKDLPTAFHTIFGTTLFLFGNLIAQDHSLVLQGEPTTPTPYWLSAIDVFQTGENLPIRLSGRNCPSAPEDWRMAVVWGRTLVNLADEVLTRQKSSSASSTGIQAQSLDPRFAGMNAFTSIFSPPVNTLDEPNWPAESAFAMIALRRPPSSFRINLNNVTPDELLRLAQDQFCRGIFHMPHQRAARNQLSTSTPTTAGTEKGSLPRGESRVPSAEAPKPSLALSLPINTFSRAKELYTIGSEVLLLAEKLDIPSERYHWASWADGVFSQMKMESNGYDDSWSVSIASSRGRCNLVMGSAKAEELDSALERGDMDVLDTEEGEDAREALKDAIVFLEKARELMSSDSVVVSSAEVPNTKTSCGCCDASDPMVVSTDGEDDEDIEAAAAAIIDDTANLIDDTANVIMSADDDETAEQAENRTLLAEALLTLANLTADEVEREALYAKAHKEGKGAFELEEDRMDESN